MVSLIGGNVVGNVVDGNVEGKCLGVVRNMGGMKVWEGGMEYSCGIEVSRGGVEYSGGMEVSLVERLAA